MKKKHKRDLIGFRPRKDWPFAEPFLDAVNELGVTISDLARLSIEKGLHAARKQMAEEKRLRDKNLKDLTGSFEPGRSLESRLCAAAA